MNDAPKHPVGPDPASELASDHSPIDPRDFRTALGSYATGPAPANSIAVLLEARDEAELRSLAETCADALLIVESDGKYAGQAMAIGFPPRPDKRKELAHLKLWRKV